MGPYHWWFAIWYHDLFGSSDLSDEELAEVSWLDAGLMSKLIVSDLVAASSVLVRFHPTHEWSVSGRLSST